MHKKLFLAFALAAALASPALQAADPGQPDAAAKPADDIARGLMMFHEGRMIFSPCRERSYVEVEDASPGAGVTAALKELGLDKGKPLYVELFGEADGGSLRIRALNFAHTAARCHAPRQTTGHWRAIGRGPAWSLTTRGEEMRLQREGQPDLEAKLSESREDDTLTRLQVQGESGAAWEMRRGLCRQPEDGLVSGWTARFEQRGTRLQGCAWRP